MEPLITNRSKTHPLKPYTSIENEILEDLYQRRGLPGEARILLYLIRAISGFGKTQDEVGLDQIENGIKTRKWTMPGTGISKRSAIRGLKELERIGAIGAIRRRGRGKVNTYILNGGDKRHQNDDLSDENKGVRLVTFSRSLKGDKPGKKKVTDLVIKGDRSGHKRCQIGHLQYKSIETNTHSKEKSKGVRLKNLAMEGQPTKTTGSGPSGTSSDSPSYAKITPLVYRPPSQVPKDGIMEREEELRIAYEAGREWLRGNALPWLRRVRIFPRITQEDMDEALQREWYSGCTSIFREDGKRIFKFKCTSLFGRLLDDLDTLNFNRHKQPELDAENVTLLRKKLLAEYLKDETPRNNQTEKSPTDSKGLGLYDFPPDVTAPRPAQMSKKKEPSLTPEELEIQEKNRKNGMVILGIVEHWEGFHDEDLVGMGGLSKDDVDYAVDSLIWREYIDINENLPGREFDGELLYPWKINEKGREALEKGREEVQERSGLHSVQGPHSVQEIPTKNDLVGLSSVQVNEPNFSDKEIEQQRERLNNSRKKILSLIAEGRNKRDVIYSALPFRVARWLLLHYLGELLNEGFITKDTTGLCGLTEKGKGEI